MPRPLRLLLIEDLEEDAVLLLAEIESGGFDVSHARVDSLSGLLDALTTAQWDLVISDYTLPQLDAMAAMHLIRQHDPDLPVIITSGNIGEEIAVNAMRAGACDYLMKNNLSRLTPAIDRELSEGAMRRAARQAQMQLKENEARFRAIASNIPGMVFQLLVSSSGHVVFSYVSEGCKELLNLPPADLLANSELFCNRMLDKTKSSLRNRLMASSLSLHQIVWEGRIEGHPSGSKKWISVRMSPHRLEAGTVQWDGIAQDISPRKFAELDLLRSQRRLSALSSHLQIAKEAERMSVAREVHDDIGGNLTAIKIDILWLIKHMASANSDVKAKLHSLEFLADRTLQATSRIAHDLRPPLLDLGLLAAVQWEASEFTKRTEIPCLIRSNNDDIAVRPELANALFSVFRESLTNISKHSRATRVEVSLTTDNCTCTLSVTDNGQGFMQTDLLKEKSFGIRGMLERMRNLSGELEFSGSPGIGTTITARLPLHDTVRPQANSESSRNYYG